MNLKDPRDLSVRKKEYISELENWKRILPLNFATGCKQYIPPDIASREFKNVLRSGKVGTKNIADEIERMKEE